MVRPRQSPPVHKAAILLAIIAVLYFARGILVPLVFAVVLSLVLSPAVCWLQKLRIPRFPATLFVMFFAVCITGSVGYVIVDQLLQVASDLPGYRANIDNKIKALKTPGHGALERATQTVREIGKELAAPPEAIVAPAPIASMARIPGRPTGVTSPASANPVAVRVIDDPGNELVYIRAVSQPFLGPLAELGIVLIFAVFLLVEEAAVRNRIFRLAGLHRLNLMTQAVEEGTRRVSRYLVLQLVVNLAFGILCGIGLYAIGVPYAVLWGAVAAILRIVPYVGSLIAGAMPLLLSLAVFEGWRAPVLVFALFATLELITANLLEPWLYGIHTGISSLALLLATVFWAALWGPAGLILSTPLTVCVVVLGRYVPHLSFLHVLLGDQPVLTPDAQLYQRLLAMDDEEARAVAEQYRQEHSLAGLYDGVIIPALIMAEQDRHKGALDPEREEFLFLTLREIIAGTADESPNQEHCDSQPVSEDQTRPLQVVPAMRSQRIFCVAAYDEADEIAASMLAQLLERAGCATMALPVDSSLATTLRFIEPTEDDIFCISAVPPFAFSQAKKLSRELRVKFPGIRVVIAVWGFGGDTKRAVLHFRPDPPDRFLTNFMEALECFAGRGSTENTANQREGCAPAETDRDNFAPQPIAAG